MTDKKSEITLGGKKFKLDALEFDTLIKVMTVFGEIGTTPSMSGETLEKGRDIICLAVGLSHEDFAILKPDVADVRLGLDTVADISGIKRLGREKAERAKANASAG